MLVISQLCHSRSKTIDQHNNDLSSIYISFFTNKNYTFVVVVIVIIIIIMIMARLRLILGLADCSVRTGKRLQHNHNNRHEIDILCSENLVSNKRS